MPQPPVNKPLQLPFIELQSIDSTNNYARQLLHAGLAKPGTCIFAHEQTAGKGQRGKNWIAEKDANILMSLILEPKFLAIHRQFELIACVATAVHLFFSRYTTDDTKIKWPNDLYWQDRKAGGILIESVIASRESGMKTMDWAIAGIGININQTKFPGSLSNPVSLKQITGKNFDTVQLAKELTNIIFEQYGLLQKEGFEKIHQQYLEHLYKKNERVTLKKANRNFEAVIRSVSNNGKLVVEHSIEEEFDFGEIEWAM